MAFTRKRRFVPDHDDGADNDPYYAVTLGIRSGPPPAAGLNFCGLRSSESLARALRSAVRRKVGGGNEDEAEAAGAAAAATTTPLWALLSCSPAAASPASTSASTASATASATSATSTPAPPAAHLRVRASWGGWRPWNVAERRAPAAARRFSLPDAVLEGMSPEQRQAAYLAEAGLNVFVTGPGGTGKSALIHAVAEAARGEGIVTAVTASTGIAARNIGGTTLHRFAGFGLMRGGAPASLHRVRDDEPRCRRWRDTNLLIVDEVSMLSSSFLRGLDDVARHLRLRDGRDHHAPFGEMQLLFFGDFAQLTMRGERGGGGSGSGSDSAPLPLPPLTPHWQQLLPFTVLLSTIFRQRDPGFKAFLNRVRLGAPGQEDLALLRSMHQPEDRRGGARPPSPPASQDPHQEEPQEPRPQEPHTVAPALCAFRGMVREENERALCAAVPRGGAGGVHTFLPWLLRDAASPPAQPAEALPPGFDDLEPRLVLCEGARVLLTKNLDPERGLVNGALGQVLRFEPFTAASAAVSTSATPLPPPPVLAAQPYPVVRFEGLEGEVLLLPTAYTLDEESANQKGKQQAEGGEGKQQQNQQKRQRKKAGGVSTTTTAAAEGASVEVASYPAVFALPLLCAWAMTVHRAQGMTLPAARIYGDSMRSPALLYTALSRVRDPAQVRLVGRHPPDARNIVADPDAVRYYRRLERLCAPPLAVVPSAVVGMEE